MGDAHLAIDAWKNISEIRAYFAENRSNYSILVSQIDNLNSRLEQLKRLENHTKEIEEELSKKENLQKVQVAAFRNQDLQFSQAQDSHQGWAAACIMFILFGILLIGLFFAWNINGLDVKSKDISNNVLLFTGLGKISFMLFIVWGIRYLMIIHMAHSAQTITYRDRRMALAVAEATFNLSETADGKSNVLAKVVDSCFDLSKNSFYNIKDPHLLPSAKQIGALSEALKPVLALAKVAASDAKGEEKETKKEKEIKKETETET